MTSTDREVDVNLVHILFIDLSPVPVYGVAHVHRLYDVVQHVYEEAQNHDQQYPGHYSHEICIVSQMDNGFQKNAYLHIRKTEYSVFVLF